MPAPPERVGRYRVIGRLAVGGMAEILIGALDGAAGFTRPVVIKRVLPKHARRADFRSMFIDEARIVSGLRHANVVDVLELAEDGDALYLAMEYLEGESLDVVSKRLAQDGRRLPPALAAYVIAEAAAGLHAAHQYRDAEGVAQEIVHRDVSPHNLFLGYDGGVKVIDFGIAKAVNRETKTETGTVKGKFAYMSPEQIDGRNVDRRTDVFALGVVLWETLVGKRLFGRANHLEIVKAICFAPIPAPRDARPEVDVELDRIVQKALSRDLEERYATAAELRRDLITALRALDPEGLAQEQLAALLAGVFTERVEAKREMLRKIASGSQVTAVPAATDLELDIDDLVAVDTSEVRETALQTTVPVPDEPRRRAPLIGAAIVAIVALLIMGGFMFGEEGDVDEPDPPPRVAEAPTPAPPPVAPPDTPALPASITVTIDSVPSGAVVRVDGEPQGTTPSAITLQREDTTHEVTVELEGFVSAHEQIDATVDQRLRIVLEREPRRPPRRASSTSSPSSPPEAERAPVIFRVD